MTDKPVDTEKPSPAEIASLVTPRAKPDHWLGLPPLALRIGTLLAGLALWAAVAATGAFHPSIFPSPWDVGVTLFQMTVDGSLIRHIVVSLSRVFVGFALAAAIAIPLGFAMGLSRRAFMIVEPLIEFLRPVPPLALVPLAVVWFGIGWTSKVFLIAYGCFFAIVVNTVAGMKAVDPVHVRAALALGANRWQILWHVILRSAVPDIVVGLRLAVGLAFLLIVGSELIAASEGLGWLIWDARYHFQGDVILVGMIAIGVVGLLLNRLLLVMERYLLRWKSSDEGDGRIAGLN